MIDFKEIKTLAEKSYLDDAGVNLYLFENKKTKQDPLSLHELNINQEVVKTIRSLSNEYLLSITKQAKPPGMIPAYNPDLEQELFKISGSDVEMFKGLYEYVLGNKSCVAYIKKNVKEEKLKAWIFRFEVVIDGLIEQILFFQRFQPGKMLGSKGVTLFERGGKFELVGKNILNFNLVMDMVYFKDTFIVTRSSSFEYIFGYEEYYKDQAAKLVRELSEGTDLNFTLRFSDIKATHGEIETSARLVRKLSSARVNGYYRKIDYKKLSVLNKKHGLHLHLDDRKQEWLIDQQSDLQVMARIFNDDYEISQLTDNEYIAYGKEKI
jgi:hypothetical protein